MKQLGILGGGQLGRMLCEAAVPLGVKTRVWAPPGDNPAAFTANTFLEAGWDNLAAFDWFAEGLDAVTLEFENVPLALVEKLEERLPVRPSSRVLKIAQDRWQERCFFDRNGIPYPATFLINRWSAVAGPWISGWRDLPFPMRLKSCRLGYDGKGQHVVASGNEVQQCFNQSGGVSHVLQENLTLAYELSVMVARDVFGNRATWSPIENEHREHILRVSRCPGPSIADEVAEAARGYALEIAEALELVGVLGVEFFAARKVVEGREAIVLLANELAPRPHNSAHGTIEASSVSQFEQLVRVALGEPLITPTLRTPWCMENLIGEEIERAPALAEDPAAHLHVYGKREARPGRKMGHVTWIAAA